MYNAITQINALFNAAIDAANPAPEWDKPTMTSKAQDFNRKVDHYNATQPEQPTQLTQQDKDFFVWLARHG